MAGQLCWAWRSGCSPPWCCPRAPAFEAQVQKINDAGGIEGREIDLTICNDQGNPQVASHCA